MDIAGGTWVGLKLADGRYEIDSKLGEGGMGVVYRGATCTLAPTSSLKLPADH